MATSINTTSQLLPDYYQLWATMVIRPEWLKRAKAMADAVRVHQKTYEAFVQAFNPDIPWYFVGVIHMMEASGSFNCHLHNGDSLANQTVCDPKGRPVLPPLAGIGKPYTWQESARDALTMENYDKMHEWTVTRMLARMEAYNGFGYRKRGIYSPYVWSGTNHYTAGKYVADGHFDSQVVSKQVGAAAMVKLLMA
jgi:lysozyme family protein